MISYEEELQIHQSMKIPTYEGWYFRVTDGAISIAIWVGRSEERRVGKEC